MPLTNFTTLLDEQKAVWSRQTWAEARELSFLARFIGKGPNSMIQHITELTKTERGDRAIFTLVADLVEDGITGDNILEGNEEGMKAYDQAVTIDQLRHAVRSEGKLAEQKTIVQFREKAKSALAHWLADRLDQLLFLSLSGVPAYKTLKGANRADYSADTNGNRGAFGSLAFAHDGTSHMFTAPTAGRHCMITSAGAFTETVDNTAITADSKISYDVIVDLRAFARDSFLKPLRGPGGQELYHLFLSPKGMAQLKKDTDFKQNARLALPRSEKNPLWAGSESYYVDGVMVHDYRHVYQNSSAGANNMWGATGNVAGQRALLCGAQALAMADIGPGEWNEETFDYKNQGGIEYGKIFGVKKPKFNSIYSGSEEDFGVIALDTAI